MYPKWTLLLLPYARLELPGWGKLLRLARVSVSINDCQWSNAPKKLIRGKLHGYWMKLDLSDWSERYTYFLGRYYELEIQQLLSAILKPGDRFVDIGANIGMITLHAARLVTEKGKIDCFEPNPDCVQSIKDTLARNNLRHVNVYPVGLSDSTGMLQLSLTSSHTGTATLAPVHGVTKSFEVPTLIGDDVVLSDPTPMKLIKIDVEGFELHVLKGLKRALDMFQPFLITEFAESHFQRAGTSSTEILRFLTGLGYKPYGISARRKWMRYRFQLVPLADRFDDRGDISDILWVHGQNPFGAYTEKYIKTT